MDVSLQCGWQHPALHRPDRTGNEGREGLPSPPEPQRARLLLWDSWFSSRGPHPPPGCPACRQQVAGRPASGACSGESCRRGPVSHRLCPPGTLLPLLLPRVVLEEWNLKNEVLDGFLGFWNWPSTLMRCEDRATLSQAGRRALCTGQRGGTAPTPHAPPTSCRGEEPVPRVRNFQIFPEHGHSEVACPLLRSLVGGGKGEGELGDPSPSSSATETTRRLVCPGGARAGRWQRTARADSRC